MEAHRASLERPEGEVSIAVVGKYTGLIDAYKSLNEALIHGGIANHCRVNMRWIDADEFLDGGLRRGRQTSTRSWSRAASASAASRARSRPSRTPAEASSRSYGLCFGMQLA